MIQILILVIRDSLKVDIILNIWTQLDILCKESSLLVINTIIILLYGDVKFTSKEYGGRVILLDLGISWDSA